ncbi:MAG: vitamin B12 dependent-methionine synthase activation domain-containing protein, partial [Ghiorsea sp.]|nr:vitamin B12 dependent-methionine synthase activation domain-containing protein [Ghiorsea sp.]
GVRERYLGRQKQTDWLKLEEARANPTLLNEDTIASAPKTLGVQVLDNLSIADIREYIDWSPFFGAWELNGAYPRILNDPHKGKEAQKLFDDANVWLDKIIAENWFTAKQCLVCFCQCHRR